MEYTAQNLEYAVSVFYNGEQSERAKAHAWLTAAQRVPEAWNFVWELLQPSKNTEVQFYAATTLHTKILRCWNEVPPESYDELKDKILQAVFTYSKGPKIVTNRLCISLAAFILQQGTGDLATILRPLSSEENTSLLLEVLTVIPEEFNSMTMGSALRTKNRVALQKACPAVLEDMLRHLQSVYSTDYCKEAPSEQTIQSWVTAATCACSWLTLGGEDAAEHPGGSLSDRMPLCRALLAIVQLLYTWNSAVSDTALDACEACLSAVRAAGGTTASSKHSGSALQLMGLVAACAAPVMQRDNVPNSPNEELLSSLITCCVALGECHANILVQAAENETEAGNGARQLIELLLAAQAAPGHYPIHETRSNLAFGFWYTLQDEILNVEDPSTDMHSVWRPVFSRLLTTLVKKSEAPTDLQLSRDDLELLRCYRQDIADTVMYCYGVLGGGVWGAVLAAHGAAGAGAGREAALHVFCALADAAPAGLAPPPLLQLLDHARAEAHASTDKRMLNTALDCLGSYASWVSTVQGGALGAACVAAAGAALTRCAPAAALALRKLAADCSPAAAALAPDIVQAAQSHEGRSDTWVRRQLVAAAGAALAAAELDVAAPLLHSLANMLENDLRTQAGSPRGAACSAACCAALLGALAPRAPLAAALFRTVAPALPPYAGNTTLVEPLFHILKQTVTSLIDDLLPLVSDIGQLIVAGFNTSPCPSGLDVVKLVVISMGSEWDGARNLLNSTVTATVRTLAPDPSARPELTEALFALLQAITKKRPQYVDWLEDILPDLVELACGSVRLWSAGAARGACGWLGALAGARAHVLQPAAPLLTAAAVACIGGATPRNQIEPLAELLLALNRASWRAGGELAAWLRQALAQPDFPTVHATEPHKQKFMAAVIKEKSSKRRLLEHVQEFSLVCRGLVDTEYGRQTLASKQLVA
ncbi:importin-13-like protein cdm [Anticarsia gemmatalis]|uniref:importin-13-like protein cdm n=1 Tax=Anticarsia gemmatalis TaxID=129554 RepID=UPI003F75AA7B